MRKILFTLFLILGANTTFAITPTEALAKASTESISTVYSDSKEIISTVYSDSKEVVSTMYPELKSAIQEIAKGIGVAAEHVYGILIKQQVVIAVEGLIILLASIAVLIFCIKGLWTSCRDMNIIKYSVYALLGVISLYGIITVDFREIITGLINPEWGALNYILNYSKSIL